MNAFSDDAIFEDLSFGTPIFEVPSFEKNEKAEMDKISIFLNNHFYIKQIFEESISTVEDEFDPEIYEISKPEADEMMEKIISIVESLHESGLSIDLSNEFKRYMHTFKGSVRMAGSNKLGMLAHRLESLLDYIEERNINIFDIKTILEREISKIEFLMNYPNKELSAKNLQWLDSIKDDETIEDKLTVEEKEITENLTEEEKKEFKEEKVIQKQELMVKEQKQFIRVVADKVDHMINEAGDIRLARTTLEGLLKNNKKSLTDLKNSSSKLIEMVKEIQLQAETQIQSKKNTMENAEDFDPLEFDRFTRLQELTRFMNEAVADVQETVSSMESIFRVQENSIAQQSILTNSLLANLMKVRLLPMESISDRLYKITRNTSKELQKLVTLELNGEKTEMDRLVLEKITSPIEHLLRNCIAHGIESPKDRIEKNKIQVGKIKIDTIADGNFIVIKIQDDGAGINASKVKSIAVKKGLIKESDVLSQKEVVELIFKPGFSTAETVSHVAGRGVGMDVVKSEIAALGGYVDVETTEGLGTVFKITLPVAIVTNQTMLVSVMDKLIAIPTALIEEVISIKQDKIKTAYDSKSLNFKNMNKEFVYAGHLLGLLNIGKLPEIKVYNSVIRVVYKDKELFVHVDKIITTNEILIKSVGPIYGKIEGILGATLMGDGTQGFVINPILLKQHFEKNIRNIKSNDGNTNTEVKRKSNLTIMIVDDSITVRRATTKVLEKYGYNIVTAKDGSDGLEQLQIVIPDIILSDIEMPKMDGFEFARNIKNIDTYKNIPIIMITSRTADKHKKLAFEIGVEGFLGKPYKEDELIENILKLTSKASD